MSLYGFEENSENSIELDSESVHENSEDINVDFGEDIQTDKTVPVFAEDNSTVTTDAVSPETVLDELTGSSPKKKKHKKKTKSIINEILSFMGIILAAFFVAILINIYCIRSSNVVGTSMYPTLQNGQSVLISRLPYIFSEPERGDIIVFDAKKKERTFVKDFSESLMNNAITKIFTDDRPAYEGEEFYIKRIVGIAGDTITVKDYVMYINGKPLANNGYTVNDDGTAFYGCEGMTWTVGEGYVFVLGDNRINSKDSRIMGFIPTDCIMGKVVKE